jgi:hypothetical protein
LFEDYDKNRGLMSEWALPPHAKGVFVCDWLEGISNEENRKYSARFDIDDDYTVAESVQDGWPAIERGTSCNSRDTYQGHDLY